MNDLQYDNLQIINRRNTITVEQALKELHKKLETQEIRINSLNKALSSLTTRLNEFERMLILQKIKSVGTGPTVKL